MERRDFLKQSALTAAAAAILPTEVGNKIISSVEVTRISILNL